MAKPCIFGEIQLFFIYFVFRLNDGVDDNAADLIDQGLDVGVNEGAGPNVADNDRPARRFE